MNRGIYVQAPKFMVVWLSIESGKRLSLLLES